MTSLNFSVFFTQWRHAKYIVLRLPFLLMNSSQISKLCKYSVSQLTVLQLLSLHRLQCSISTFRWTVLTPYLATIHHIQVDDTLAAYPAPHAKSRDSCLMFLLSHITTFLLYSSLCTGHPTFQYLKYRAVCSVQWISIFIKYLPN
jgi:hypothetical protein